MYTGNPDVPDDVFADVLKEINAFVRTRVMSRQLEIMATDVIPDDLRKQAAEMGLFGYAIPQEWGGLGLDLVQEVDVAMELGYTSLSLRSMFGTNNGIAGQVLVGFGTEEQKAQWLPGIASGEVVASFALTEPGRSNPAGLNTTAVAARVGWVIDGKKQFITNATEAGLFVVFARTAPPQPPAPASRCSSFRPTRRGRGGGKGRQDGSGRRAHRRRHVLAGAPRARGPRGR